MTDLVNHPNHYEKHSVTVKIEPYDLVERCGYLLGNTLKYCFRWQDKGTPLLDLKKAQNSVNRLISNHYDVTVCDGVAPDYMFEFFAPTEESKAVTQVPIWAPITMGIAAP